MYTQRDWVGLLERSQGSHLRQGAPAGHAAAALLEKMLCLPVFTITI